jgi:hypothetical protein
VIPIRTEREYKDYGFTIVYLLSLTRFIVSGIILLLTTSVSK